MSLCNLSELLNDAKEKKYAVLCTDVFNFDFAEAVFRAAEEKKSPVIVGVCDDLFKFFNFDKLIPPIILMAKESKVRVAIHLDHSSDFKTIMRCMKAGFTSVMYDGSMLPLDDNIKAIKEIVKIAHSLDISVEGEVGVIGGREGGFDYKSKVVNKENYTRVEDAKRFVEETNVDALAIAVGTIHGVYRGEFDIDFNRIAEIRKKVRTPLVLHGASGLSDNDFREVVKNGITKVNYYTNLILVGNNKLKEILNNDSDFNYVNLNYEVISSMKEEIKLKMDILGSSNKF